MRKALLMANPRVFVASAVALGVALVAGSALAQETGLSISGPGPGATTQPTTRPATTAPATPSAVPPPATQPTTPDAAMEDLLHNAPVAPLAAPVRSGPAILTPALPGVAPQQPAITRLREGDHIWNRTGRLLRDEKTAQWVFAFDADGKQMQDPPMFILPSRMLKVMEQATDEGRKAVRLKISGDVTEYEGRNYLLVSAVQTVPDLNQF
jgi:hypothetical protein